MSGFGKIVAGYIFNDEMKEKMINKMNENVDIPFISEKTEAKILDAIWDSVEEVVKEALIEDQMPKQVYHIKAFEGGINKKADPRDIEDNQLVEVKETKHQGKIRMIRYPAIFDDQMLINDKPAPKLGEDNETLLK